MNLHPYRFQKIALILLADGFGEVFLAAAGIAARVVGAGRAIPVHAIEDLQQQQEDNCRNCLPTALSGLPAVQNGSPFRRHIGEWMRPTGRFICRMNIASKPRNANKNSTSSSGRVDFSRYPF